MTGVLILAAGVPRAFEDVNFGVITLGYVVMRLAMVALWLRAGCSIPKGRPCALRYAIGIARGAGRVGRASRGCPTTQGLVAFFLLATLELCDPDLGGAGGSHPWHPRHIAERYGLFTIIVLGESVLSATVGVQAAIDLDSNVQRPRPGRRRRAAHPVRHVVDLLRPAERASRRADAGATSRSTSGAAFTWGYGHFPVFASIGRGRWRTPRRGRPRHAATPTSRVQAAFAFTHPRVRCTCSRCGRCTTGSSGPRGCGAGPCRRGRPDPRVDVHGRTRARDRCW